MRRSLRFTSSALAIATVGGALIFSAPACAQDARGIDARTGDQRSDQALTKGATGRESKASDSSNEEIVVTAQRRGESLQKVPIAISVLSGDMLDTSSSRGTTDALRATPAVQIQEGFQTGGTTIAIRGVNVDGPISQGASPTAYYLDTVPFGFVKNALAPDANAYDLERIEVLRGPQGTLYGASALNGVVRVLTRDADLNNIEIKGRILGSTTRDGGGNYRGDAAVNLPISEGKLAVRLVGGYQHLSGWIDAPNRENINDGDLLNLRAKINAQPTENLSIGLSAWISRTEYGAPSTSRVDGTSRATLDESIHSDFDSFGLKIGYEFSSFAATSATSYLRYKLRSKLDLGNLNIPNVLLDADIDSDMLSQEISLNSTGSGPWRWSAGVFYRKASDTLTQLRHTPEGVPTLGYFRSSIVKYTSESYAVFGELTRVFADGMFDLSAGIRYFHDDVGLREKSRFDNAGTALVSKDSKFNAVTPRVVLTARPVSNLNLYLSYSQGFRSGTDQNPAVVRIDPNFGPAKPDKVHNYEFGAKGAILDGAVVFDAALYYVKWQGVQQTLTATSCATCAVLTAFINGESISGPGFDLGVTARPFKFLTLRGSFSVNDLTFDTAVLAANGAALYNKGDRLSNSQKYTASGGADITLPLGDGYSAMLSGNVSYGSSTISQSLSGTNLVFTPSDPITLSSLNFMLTSPAEWSASLFVDNLTDVKGTPRASSLSPDWAQRLRPRTIGVQFDFTF